MSSFTASLQTHITKTEEADPTIFVNLTGPKTVPLISKINKTRSELASSHLKVVNIATRLIDSGQTFTEVWVGSELDLAIKEKAGSQQTFLRAARQAFREHSSKPERLTSLLRQQQIITSLKPTDDTHSSSSHHRSMFELRLATLADEIQALVFWNKFVAKLKSDVSDITETGMQPPSLLPLTAASQTAKTKWEEFNETESKFKNKKVTKDLLEEARTVLQMREKEFQLLRANISHVASRHFPHLFVLHPILRITGGDIFEEEDGLFVENRHLDHFSIVKELSSDRSGHIIRLVTFDGGKQQCVLKEYRITEELSTRRRLRREAKLLRLLGEHPHIASVDAVFVHPPTQGMQLGYIQMPFYSQGSLTSFIEATKPEKNVLQNIFASISQALAHVHANGVVHADIKLENVLIDEHGIPHLADFEMSRAKEITSTTSGGGVGTANYMAPEVRSATPGEQMKPPSDLFSFGVMFLLAFCPTEFEQNDNNTLKRISCDEDKNLRDLVQDLLQANPSKRPSAVEVTTYPFLDPVRLFEKANEQIHQALEEEKRVEREAKETARKLRQKETEARQRLQEEEEEAQERVRAAKEKVAIQQLANKVKSANLKKEEVEIEKREKSVDKNAVQVEKDRAAVKIRKAEIAAENKSLEKETARINKERADLAKIKAAKIAIPSSWINQSPTSTGFKLQPISKSTARSSVWQTLERTLNTSTWTRSSGQSPYDANPYTYLTLGRAWRNENTSLWKKYCGARDQVGAEVARLRKLNKPPTGISTAMQRASNDLPASLDSSLNEIYAVHGTHPNLLPKLLETGTNARYTQTAYFGYGTYFGDDAKTSDHYVSGMDIKMQQFPEFHKLIYSNQASHPNSGNDQSDKGTYYMLICRVVMGKYAKLQGSNSANSGSRNHFDNNLIFAQAARNQEELNTVPETSLHYHGLHAVKPGGQVEIIQFHDEQVYPEYLVAYHRTNKVLKEPSYRIWQLKQSNPQSYNMQRREDVQILIAHTMIWTANCGVAGGFVRDFVINNEPSNDVDVLLLNGTSIANAFSVLQNMASRYGGIHVQQPQGKGSTNCAIIKSSSNSWVEIEVDLSDPVKLGGLSPPPGIDTNAGNLMFTRKGIELKINVKGLPTVAETIEHIKSYKFVYLQDFNDQKMYGNESGSSKCQRRLTKYLERQWTCITPVPDSIMNTDKFKKYKPLVKPEKKWTKDWHKMK